jgi:hypothetical protein
VHAEAPRDPEVVFTAMLERAVLVLVAFASSLVDVSFPALPPRRVHPLPSRRFPPLSDLEALPEPRSA